VGPVVLGETRVNVLFPKHGGMFAGTVVAYCRPWFRVVFDDGDVAEYEGHELARHIVFEEADFYNPRLWFYDFSRIHPANIPNWIRACRGFCDTFGIDIPAMWLSDTINDNASEDVVGSGDEPITAFLEREQATLRAALSGMLGAAREERTIKNLRNQGLKLLWWCASRGCNFPPTAAHMALYFTKLATDQDNIGAVSVARNALSFICAFNDLPVEKYSSLRANAALEAMRRKHKRQTKKAAGLTVNMVKGIIKAFGFKRPRYPIGQQWQLVVGTSIALGFKLLLRYDDLSRCRWDAGYCEVFHTHVRFYLDGRKNNQYGGDFLDVAAPADRRETGVYHLCVVARSVFRNGFLLAHVDGHGHVDQLRPMAHALFVRHLRAALVHIGLPSETAAVFSGQSMRSGGASAAAQHGLHREDIQHLAGVKDVNWLAYYNRKYLAERLRVSQAIGL